jgi:hypothetical protein
VRARPRFNKDEVDDEDDVVDDDAIRCKVLGETDDDDFRNKTRAMADIYILRTSFGATNFAVVVSACFLSFEKERRGKMHKNFFFTLLCCFCKSLSYDYYYI